MRRAKSGETLVEARSDTDVQIVRCKVSLSMGGREQLYDVKTNGERNRERVVLALF